MFWQWEGAILTSVTTLPFVPTSTALTRYVKAVERDQTTIRLSLNGHQPRSISFGDTSHRYRDTNVVTTAPFRVSENMSGLYMQPLMFEHYYSTPHISGIHVATISLACSGDRFSTPAVFCEDSS